MSQNTSQAIEPSAGGAPGGFRGPGKIPGGIPGGVIRGMDRISSLLEDRVNAVVVKELRQAVRSKFIMAVIHFMLIIQVCIAGFFLLMSLSSSTDFDMGRNLFIALHGFLLFGSLFFVPMYVAVRFAAERTVQNVDLLYTTTISPMSIIWGKFLSGAVVTAILFSTAAPFMVLTYMLRGIDMPTILGVLFVDYLVVIAAVQLALQAMSISQSVLSRIGMLLMCVIAFSIIMSMTMGYTSSVIMGFTSLGPSGSEFWLGWGVLLLLMAMGHGLALIAAASAISPPTSNRAFALRAYLTACWVVTYIMSAVSGAWVGADIMQGWLFFMASFFACSVFVGACERDRPGPRVQARIPRNWLLRPLAFLFYSGSAGGVAWSLIMTLLTLLAGWLGMMVIGSGWSVMRMGTSRSFEDGLVSMVSFCAYVFAYALAAVAIVRYLGMGKLKTEITFGVTLALMAAGCILPPLTLFFLEPDGSWDRGILWRIGNPLAGIMNVGYYAENEHMTIILFVSVAAAVLAMVVCAPWFIRQVAAFKPLPRPARHDTPSIEADAPPEEIPTRAPDDASTQGQA